MKIWYGYGSEHSMKLVMIGQFKDLNEAVRTKETIDKLTEQVGVETQNGTIQTGVPTDRYSDQMLDLLAKLNVHSIAPYELEQFAYDIHAELTGNKITVTTDESDVSAFLKLLIGRGARVEVFSAHFYPREGSGASS